MSRQAKRKLADTSCSNDRSDPAKNSEASQQNAPARKRFSARISSRQPGHDEDQDSDSPTTSPGHLNNSRDSATNATATKNTSTSGKPAQRKKKSPEMMTEEEKREDRARRNRASALKSRNKRRQRLAYLEVEYKRLQEQIVQLKKDNATLQDENSALRLKQAQQEKKWEQSVSVAATNPVSPMSAPADDSTPSVVADANSAATDRKITPQLPSAPFTKSHGPLRPGHLWRQASVDSFMSILDDVTGCKSNTTSWSSRATPLPFADDIAHFETGLDAQSNVGASLKASDGEPDEDLWAGIDDASVLCDDWITAEEDRETVVATPRSALQPMCSKDFSSLIGERLSLERLISA